MTPAPWPPVRVLRLPVRTFRFEQALAEHGPAACQRCCGPTPPPGHVRFPTLSF